MATWAKQKLPRENGELVDMQVPILVSASRSTDIPAFYADWFFYRLDKAGYSAWTNPFNGVKSYVSYKDTRFIVFWSKNPRPLLQYLPILEKRGIKQSMSRKGNCLDNSPMENFFGVMKNEMFYGHEYEFKSLEDLEKAMIKYIKYYNNERIMEKTKGLSPLAYRQQSFVQLRY